MVTQVAGQTTGPAQGGGPRQGILRTGRPGGVCGLQQPFTPLAVVATHVPEPVQRVHQAQERRHTGVCLRPGQGEPQVVVLGLQAGQPRRLLGAVQLRRGLACQRRVPVGVGASYTRLLCRVRLQVLGGVLPDTLVQRKSPGRVPPQQRMVGQRQQRTQPTSTDGQGGRALETAPEHRQPHQHPLLFCSQQSPRVREGGPQAAVALGAVGRIDLQQVEAGPQLVHQVTRPEGAHPGGGEFQGQGQRLGELAQPDQVTQVLRRQCETGPHLRGALDEQPHRPGAGCRFEVRRLRIVQAAQRDDPLGLKPQPHARGHQQSQPRNRLQQGAQESQQRRPLPGREQVFEVVEHQQVRRGLQPCRHLPLRGLGAADGQAEGQGQGRDHLGSGSGGLQRHEQRRDPWSVLGQGQCFERQPSLACSARTGQGEEATFRLPERFLNPVQLVVPTVERAEPGAARSADRRRHGLRLLEQPDGGEAGTQAEVVLEAGLKLSVQARRFLPVGRRDGAAQRDLHRVLGVRVERQDLPEPTEGLTSLPAALQVEGVPRRGVQPGGLQVFTLGFQPGREIGQVSGHQTGQQRTTVEVEGGFPVAFPACLPKGPHVSPTHPAQVCGARLQATTPAGMPDPVQQVPETVAGRRLVGLRIEQPEHLGA